uniref:Small ribosomal subunit protein bS20c n=1 Tax=Calliarthron tuberculosum TaxID=48942 RepID=M4IV76_CALTB|nr:30S ribosomal protein S20 [Calliarthron tuberculosum]AGA63877.1 30S ribosomal protein S20 [Calliarthron tuberculosum]
MLKNLSAMKRVQVSLRNRLRNKKYKSSIKTLMKRTLYSVQNKKSINDQEVINNLSQFYSQIDKAVKKGIISKNQGSRKKSRLFKELKKNVIN